MFSPGHWTGSQTGDELNKNTEHLNTPCPCTHPCHKVIVPQRENATFRKTGTSVSDLYTRNIVSVGTVSGEKKWIGACLAGPVLRGYG